MIFLFNLTLSEGVGGTNTLIYRDEFERSKELLLTKNDTNFPKTPDKAPNTFRYSIFKLNVHADHSYNPLYRRNQPYSHITIYIEVTSHITIHMVINES